MSELFSEALRFYNLPITASFGLMVVYWIMTVVGVIDTDALEPDLDIDAEAAADVDGGSFGLGLARFFSLGDVPLVVLLSVLIALVWAGAMLGNHFFNPSGSYWVAAGLLSANLIVSLFLTKLLTAPLKPVMRALKAGEKHRPVVGRTCVIRTSEVTESFGQAAAEDASGNPLLIHVRLSPGQAPLVKGDEALVVDTIDDAQTYRVRKL